MKRGLTFWLFFSIALMVSAINSYSQIYTTKIKLESIYPGYVITIENDTINGFIKLTDKTKNQIKVLFYNSPDDPEPAMKFKPKELKAYQVGPRYYESFKFQPEEDPDLVEKISNKEFGYTFDYMENIINEFNYYYLTVVSEF